MTTPEAPVVILTGGPVLTMDESNRVAEAIAYAGGRILSVGSRRDVLAQHGKGADVMDVEGQCVVPGFIDAHHHLFFAALYEGALDCDAVDSIQSLLTLIAAHARATFGDRCLVGHRFDPAKLRERRFPTIEELSEACPDRPLVVLHYSFHEAVVNARALSVLGLDSSTLDPPAGVLKRGRGGRPTGHLIETAMGKAELLARRALLQDETAFAHRLSHRQQNLFSAGLTRIVDPAVCPEMEQHYARLRENGTLRIPLLMLPVGSSGYLAPPTDRLEGRVTGDGPEELRIGHLKLFADGGEQLAFDISLPRALGTVAAMAGEIRKGKGRLVLAQARKAGLHPTSTLRLQSGIRFLRCWDAKKLANEAVARGFGLAIHALGNAAVADAVELIESVRSKHSDNPPPRIEHALALDDELIRRIADAGIQLVCQPEFLTLTGGLPSPFPGIRFLPLRSAMSAGIHVAGSSDAPVMGYHPLHAMRYAVRRRHADGTVLHAQEAIEPMQALAMYTREAARACGCLDTTGTLEPGKRADIAIVSSDLRRCLAREEAVDVMQTILGGQSVWRRPRGPIRHFTRGG